MEYLSYFSFNGNYESSAAKEELSRASSRLIGNMTLFALFRQHLDIRPVSAARYHIYGALARPLSRLNNNGSIDYGVAMSRLAYGPHAIFGGEKGFINFETIMPIATAVRVRGRTDLRTAPLMRAAVIAIQPSYAFNADYSAHRKLSHEERVCSAEAEINTFIDLWIECAQRLNRVGAAQIYLEPCIAVEGHEFITGSGTPSGSELN